MKVLITKFSILTIFCLTQCIIEHSYQVNSFIVNQSGKSLQIYFYKGGILDAEFQEVISKEEKRLVSSDETFTYSGLLSIEDFDSLIVEFDDMKKLVHYGFNKSGNNPNAILFDNQRNLFNEDNYVKETIENKKYKHESEHIFTFNEQDYLNAK